MSVAVVDSGGANISSVMHALGRLGVEARFTADPGVIRDASHVILPGVGAAGAAMRRLREHALAELVPALRQPVLGVCLGMQLLFRRSDEGDTDCLGIIPADLARLRGDDGLRVPHMGWNSVAAKPDPLFDGLDGAWFYFVHSYAAPVGDWTIGQCTHGEAFSAAVRHGNFAGVQFHPERSAAAGQRVLRQFLEAA
ncbi:MAG: imidazole glycerol phosphate synthase subunit HisH [Xanthomonadales bacterium]|nr:imidazole glycerol phosphate synthase subunit HisH [Xanthomonadales bacterium]